LLDPQRLAKHQKTEEIFERFKLRNLSDETASTAPGPLNHGNPRRALATPEQRLKEIELALKSNDATREDVLGRLSYLTSNSLPLARAQLDAGISEPKLSSLVKDFAKGGINENHPALRGFPKALLTALAARVAKSNVFVIIYSENYPFSVWSQLEVDISFRVGIPSLCIDTSPDASAPRYLRLHDQYVLWNKNEIIRAIDRLSLWPHRPRE